MTRAPRIFVIEDNARTQEALQRDFVRLGCEVIAVGSAEEALEKLEASESPDVIILDFQLPGMSGPAFYQKISEEERYKAISVVPFTALVSANRRAQSDVVIDWASYSQSRGWRDGSLPIVPKAQSENEAENWETPSELIMSVAVAVRNRGLELPKDYRALFAKLVKAIYGQ